MSTDDPYEMEMCSFAKDEVIFRDGDDGGCAYVVNSGSVEISKDADGHRVVLGAIRDAGMFGEMSLIDNAPRMATATAVEDTECIVILKKDFQLNMRGTPPFVTLLVHMLIKNVRSVSDQLVLHVAKTDMDQDEGAD
jgi:CRP-like cAMP-binding protein